MAKLFSSGCEAAYKSVFADDTPEDWCLLGYEGNSLAPVGTGTGGIQEMITKVRTRGVLRLEGKSCEWDTFDEWTSMFYSRCKRFLTSHGRDTCATLNVAQEASGCQQEHSLSVHC